MGCIKFNLGSIVLDEKEIAAIDAIYADWEKCIVSPKFNKRFLLHILLRRAIRSEFSSLWGSKK